jgi:transposase InsO family protein
LPWSQVTVIDQRDEFVRFARSPGANVSELCRRFGISRKTGYKWLSRDTLEDRSRRPCSSPARTGQELETQVLAVRDQHPAWGGRKISHVLKRDHGLELAPSTVTAVLHRHGRIRKEASEASQAWLRFEHEQPNSLWQMDFKGHFATASQRCHPLTVLDDHSRFSIVLQALGNEQQAGVQGVLQGAFERYGLPDRINTDNGAPWGIGGQGGITGLQVWLIRLGVRLGHSRPWHPQTNGKDERFHRSLKAEVLDRRTFDDLEDAQKHFRRWRHVYNFQRPHEALQMATPSSRYRTSPRAMPATLPAIEYQPGDLVRKVQQNGWFTIRSRPFRVSWTLAGQPVACRPRADRDGTFEIFFCQQKISEVSLTDP